MFSPRALTLPKDALETLIAHEAAHAHLADVPEPGHPWNDEHDINTLVRKWGFDVPLLFEATGVRRTQHAG